MLELVGQMELIINQGINKYFMLKRFQKMSLANWFIFVLTMIGTIWILKNLPAIYRSFIKLF
jgi:hypothetical protein